MMTDPTGMTADEHRAARDREAGKATLHHYAPINQRVDDITRYTVNDAGVRVAIVVTHFEHYGQPARQEYPVPLTHLFATRQPRGLGLQPVPWC